MFIIFLLVSACGNRMELDIVSIFLMLMETIKSLDSISEKYAIKAFLVIRNNVYLRSKRSALTTFTQAATKSRTNFSLLSSCA